MEYFQDCAERGVDNFVVGMNSNIETLDSVGVLQKGANCTSNNVLQRNAVLDFRPGSTHTSKIKCRITKRVNDLEC